MQSVVSVWKPHCKRLQKGTRLHTYTDTQKYAAKNKATNTDTQKYAYTLKNIILWVGRKFQISTPNQAKVSRNLLQVWDTKDVNGVKNADFSTQLEQKFLNIETRKQEDQDIVGIIMNRDIQTFMKELMNRDGEQIMEVEEGMIIWIGLDSRTNYPKKQCPVWTRYNNNKIMTSQEN